VLIAESSMKSKIRINDYNNFRMYSCVRRVVFNTSLLEGENLVGTLFGRFRRRCVRLWLDDRRRRFNCEPSSSRCHRDGRRPWLYCTRWLNDSSWLHFTRRCKWPRGGYLCHHGRRRTGDRQRYVGVPQVVTNPSLNKLTHGDMIGFTKSLEALICIAAYTNASASLLFGHIIFLRYG
jgi:hypothetical protein